MSITIESFSKMKNPPLQLQFYTKSDCPLCDKAKIELNKVETKLPFISIEEIDITKNIGLFSKYKLLIPILEMDGKQLFTHHINSGKVIWQLRWYRIWSYLSKK